MKSRSLTAIMAAAALATGLAACSAPTAPEQPANDEPFRVVYVGGITGNLASLSGLEVEALNMAAEELNDEDGILGREVEVEVLDSKSDPTEAVTVLQKRLSQGETPDLVRIGLSSSEALAMAPVVTRAGIPSVTVASSELLDEDDAYPLTKTISSGFAAQVNALKEFALDRGFEKITVLVPEDASGDSFLQAAQDTYGDTDIELEEARYNVADLDLSVAYQRAIQNKPDAVLVNCLGAACTRVVQSRGSVIGGTDIPMLGDGSMASTPGGVGSNLAPELSENLFVAGYRVQVGEPKLQSESFQPFYDELVDRVGAPAVMTPPACAYDGLMLFAQAAVEANSTDAQEMVDAINEKDWEKGSLVCFGDVAVDWTDDSVFPTLPADAMVVFEVSPQEGGLYPPKNLFTAGS